MQTEHGQATERHDLNIHMSAEDMYRDGRRNMPSVKYKTTTHEILQVGFNANWPCVKVQTALHVEFRLHPTE